MPTPVVRSQFGACTPRMPSLAMALPAQAQQGAQPAATPPSAASQADRALGLPLAFGNALQAMLKEAAEHGDADPALAALGRNAARRARAA